MVLYEGVIEYQGGFRAIGSLIGSKRVQEWDQVGPNGTKWDEIGPSGTKWDQVGPNRVWGGSRKSKSVQIG